MIFKSTLLKGALLIQNTTFGSDASYLLRESEINGSSKELANGWALLCFGLYQILAKSIEISFPMKRPNIAKPFKPFDSRTESVLLNGSTVS